MKKLFGILMALTIALTSVGFAPVTATEEYSLLIRNKTEDTISIKLIGEDIKYTISVEHGWKEKLVEAGSYSVKYEACGTEFSYTLVIDDGTEVIDIAVCPKNIEFSKMVLESHFAVSFDVEFVSFNEVYGENYTFTVDQGRNIFNNIESGWYYYSYEACDSTFAGEFKVLKNGRGRLVMPSCERALLIAAGVKPQNTKLSIRSKFAPAFDMTLIGPVSKFVSVSTGSTRVDLPSGTYTYFYAVNGRRFSGFIVVNPQGTTLFNVGYFDYVTIPTE